MNASQSEVRRLGLNYFYMIYNAGIKVRNILKLKN